MNKVAAETCADCGEIVGRLETPYVWKNEVVCQACYARLSRPADRPAPSSAVDPPNVPVAMVAPIYRAPPMTAAEQLASEVARAAPIHRAPRAKYVDHLRGPRLVLLLVAILFSVLPAMSSHPAGEKPDNTFAWILWAAWIALGLVSIVKKANWKEQHEH
jgi:hypothetical protein